MKELCGKWIITNNGYFKALTEIVCVESPYVLVNRYYYLFDAEHKDGLVEHKKTQEVLEIKSVLYRNLFNAKWDAFGVIVKEALTEEEYLRKKEQEQKQKQEQKQEQTKKVNTWWKWLENKLP